jgi:uncharacterized membrane protein
MLVLILGLIVLLGTHAVRMLAPGFRDAQLAANPRRWKIGYSVVSALGLVLVIVGWVIYRPLAPEVIDVPAWGRHLTQLLVLAAFILVLASFLPAGRIKATLRHPLMIGVALWAFGHLLANGDLASLILFGAILLFMLVDLVAVFGRKAPAPAFEAVQHDIVAVVGGLLAYALFAFVLHEMLFGVSPFG